MPQSTPADPLFPTQWGLQNRGQQGGHIGTDINVLPVLGTGFGQVNGAGVRVAVIDNGTQLAHPDLVANIDRDASYDAVAGSIGNGSGNPVRVSQMHGTATAGIIGAASNTLGGVGVAPGATLVVERIALKEDPTVQENGTDDLVPDDNMSASRAIMYAITARVDVANNSWGTSVPFANNQVNDPDLAALAALLTKGRDGKGTTFVISNGNERIGKSNGVLDNLKNSRFSVAVGAMDNNGVTSSYSTPGANLLVTAPGGGSTDQHPTQPGNAILTTDLVGADGYNESASPSGDYTYDFNGTSAAAPFVSGVVALMLQANPGLGYRDVQEVLAYSARLTDAANSQWTSTGAGAVNGGAAHFNVNYGYGLVDAHGAVRLAQSYGQLSLAARTEANVATASASFTPAQPLDLGNGVAAGTTVTNEDRTTYVGTGTGTSGLIQLTGGMVEHLEFNLSLTVPDASRILVILTSPSGRQITLLPSGTNASAWPSGSFSLGTDAFWGEPGAGTWQFAIISARDAEDNSAGKSVGTLNAATLTSFGPGTIAPTLNNMVYTDDFAAMAAATPARQVITGAAGQSNVLNLAATSGTNVLDLTGRVGSIGGQAVTVSASTSFSTVFGGDGLNTIFAGANNQTLHTGYGQTVLNLMAGSDTVFSRGQDTIFAGSGNSVVFGQGASLFAVGGTGAVTVSGGSGSDTLFGGAGGGVFFGGSAGGNLLVGGSGRSTLVGGGTGDVLFATGGTETMLVAGAGNQTLFGGASGAGNVYFAGSGNDLIGGGKGADRFFLGTGSSTVDGGGGGDLFVFRAGMGGGAARVNNFDAAAGDRITLQNYAAGEAARSLAGATVNGQGETTLTLSDNTRITFAGSGSLTAGAFV